MKKARKKLTLHRETITNLSDGRLSEIAGGGPRTQTICLSFCYSLCCPTFQTMCITGCATHCDTETNCVATAAC